MRELRDLYRGTIEEGTLQERGYRSGEAYGNETPPPEDADETIADDTATGSVSNTEKSTTDVRSKRQKRTGHENASRWDDSGP
jgi:hypothetical protein